MTDPLKTLPKAQLNAFKLIVKRIEWLLKDEIASALINVSPVTEATLDNVADHVKSSTAKNCQFHLISLRFVCGLEKSLQLFLSELSRAKVGNYRLVSKGKYFYLTGDESNKHEIEVQGKGEGKESGSGSEESTNHECENGVNFQQTNGTDSKDGLGERPGGELGLNVSSAVYESMLQEDGDDLYEFCQKVLLEIVDFSISCVGERSLDDSLRSRSGSLPLPEKENEDIVRRRFSDTGISYSNGNDLSLNLEDMVVDFDGFQTHGTPRNTGPNFWLFASVQGSEVIVYHHKR